VIKIYGKKLVNEFEVPPHTKIRIAATIEQRLLDEMKKIHECEIEFALENDRVPPDWSNTIEMLLRKGVKACKSARSQ